MPIGVLFVAVWLTAAVLYLIWQFATDALGAPVPDEALVGGPAEGQPSAGVTVRGRARPAGTISGAGVVG